MNKGKEVKCSRGEARRRAILDAAIEVFLENGYERTTLTAILEKSGGSRSSLYEFFGGKDGLFLAAIQRVCPQFKEALEIIANSNEPPEIALMKFATQFVHALLFPQVIAISRIMIAEAYRFPNISELFYHTGPLLMYSRLADYFSRMNKNGILKIKDPLQAARLFCSLVQGSIYYSMLMSLPETFSEEDLRRHTEMSVDIFLNGTRCRSSLNPA